MWKTWYRTYLLPKLTIDAYTPVVGSILLLLITFILAGVIASNAFDLSGDKEGLQPLMARITLESCKGGLYGIGPMSERVTLEENRIILVHEGGDSLPLDSVSIRISGYGNSYSGIPGHDGAPLIGNLSISYLSMSKTGKNNDFEARNHAVLKDGFWDTGEKLILCGQDSSVNSIESSVKVSVNGVGNTSDNYGFKVGSEVNVRVIDSQDKNIIAEQTTIVKQANDSG
jgi:archaeal type IV pilus assembly protein PilA